MAVAETIAEDISGTKRSWWSIVSLATMRGTHGNGAIARLPMGQWSLRKALFLRWLYNAATAAGLALEKRPITAACSWRFLLLLRDFSRLLQ
jgi:hypothetical protein